MCDDNNKIGSGILLAISIILIVSCITPVSIRYITYRPMTCQKYVDCPWLDNEGGFDKLAGNEGSRCVQILDTVSRVTFIGGWESISKVSADLQADISIDCWSNGASATINNPVVVFIAVTTSTIAVCLLLLVFSCYLYPKVFSILYGIWCVLGFIGFITCIGIFADYQLNRLQGICINYTLCDPHPTGVNANQDRNGPLCLQYHLSVDDTNIQVLQITAGSYYPQTMPSPCWATNHDASFYDPVHVVIFGTCATIVLPIVIAAVLMVRHFFKRRKSSSVGQYVQRPHQDTVIRFNNYDNELDICGRKTIRESTPTSYSTRPRSNSISLNSYS
ncbi:MAG: hypothetical protein Sylvanvirus8_12 [Sylvanvirus sp.]|uniref:Uncharacterized protein n=1 Tax=Sylvanvirus sp. TaxID=2487774 RepID=A0A3G5AHW2_9VIRU|nr:MAG: hypothetical protein Sylvanvirus8_12 [Sylvanvirus sp.]